jgi:ribosome recycling factor
MYNFNSLKTKLDSSLQWLKKEFSVLRSGRAAPAVLDTILVNSYGSRLSIKELASVNVEDARTIRITPWDSAQIKAIETAIINSNLGLSVTTDERGLRVFFPELTSERRAALLKVAKEKLEEARIKIRAARDEIWQDINAKERAKEISEDEKFRLKDTMQKIVDEANHQAQILFEGKEKEITA